jgi:PTS system nitrogen regulatory IIA component
VLLVPEAATERHLQLLSELAQMFSDRKIRDKLLSAPDPDSIHTIVQQWNTD